MASCPEGLRRGERGHGKKSREQQEEYFSRPQSDAHIPGDRAFLESYHKQGRAAGLVTEWLLGRVSFLWEALVKVAESR